MNLTRFEPYREMQTFQDRLNRVFGNFGRGERDEEMNLSAWAPPVDIAEEKDRIMITAELPGFRDNEISIQTEHFLLEPHQHCGIFFKQAQRRNRVIRVSHFFGNFNNLIGNPVTGV